MPKMISKEIADEVLKTAIDAVHRQLGGVVSMTPSIIASYMPLIVAHMEIQAKVSHTIMLETQVGRVLAAAAAGTPTD